MKAAPSHEAATMINIDDYDRVQISPCKRTS
jgi:hypothetical protein